MNNAYANQQTTMNNPNNNNTTLPPHLAFIKSLDAGLIKIATFIHSSKSNLVKVLQNNHELTYIIHSSLTECFTEIEQINKDYDSLSPTEKTAVIENDPPRKLVLKACEFLKSDSSNTFEEKFLTLIELTDKISEYLPATLPQESKQASIFKFTQ